LFTAIYVNHHEVHFTRSTTPSMFIKYMLVKYIGMRTYSATFVLTTTACINSSRLQLSLTLGKTAITAQPCTQAQE
jgi:hypothetical protein